jgi:Protein of unknown function (DUF3558)
MRPALLIGVVIMALASGCTRTEAGQPSPGGSDSPTASTPAQPSTSQLAAPPVSNPKDARDIAVCDALKPEQISQLGLNPDSRREEPMPQPFRKGCAWTAPDGSWAVGLAFDTTRQGLSETYLRRDNYQHFQPRAIDGYPAVDAQTSFSAEDCYTYVGIADTQQLYINVDNRPALADGPLKPPCERADEIVKMIIGNLPPLK